MRPFRKAAVANSVLIPHRCWRCISVILELAVAQQGGQELVVGDVLNQGHHRGSGLLIDLLIVEAGISCADLIS